MSLNGFNSPAELREKLLGYVKFRSPAMVPEDEFVVNYTPVVRQLHTVKDFKDYIYTLQKALSGYEMKRVMSGDDFPQTYKKFELSIMDILAPYNLMPYVEAVLEVIELIPNLLELSDKEKADFYRDLVNNHAAKVGLLTIVSQTVKEFISQDLSNNSLTDLKDNEGCGCKGADGAMKARYSRLSFALVVADNTLEEHSVEALKVYECKTAAGTNYHLTKKGSEFKSIS
jgi:hypothetical protein